jgi:SAM-dependent methyltransferase
MDAAEFDSFADEYQSAHASNIKASGEAPEFFHEYKVADVARALTPAVAQAQLQVLDFGCGVGNSLPHFRRHFPKSALTGADVSAKCLTIAEHRFPDAAHLVQLEPDQPLPFESEVFDVVFAACVFHHVAHAEHVALLREWRRVLKPGGTAFVFEHNPYNPLTVHAVNTCAFDKNAALISARKMALAFKVAGLMDPQCRYRIFFPHVLRGLRGLEAHLGWLPIGAQYCVSARRVAA